MQRIAACLLVACVALAGCSSPDKVVPISDAAGNDDETTTTAPPTNGTQTSTSTTSTTGPSTDTPPSAVLEASPTTGGAPLTVSFTLDGSDPDGDALSWTFDADGDGQADAEGDVLPGNASFTYTEGAYTANLTVLAGGAAAHAAINITVEAAAEEPEEPPAPASQTVDASYVVAAEGCIAPVYETGETDAGSAASGETDDVVRIQFAVVAGTIGKAWTADFTFDVGYLYGAVDFFDADGALVSTTNTGQAPNMGNLQLTGTVPAAAATGVLFACAGPTEASVHYQAG